MKLQFMKCIRSVNRAVPLVAGVTFDVTKNNGTEYSLQYNNATDDARLLNPAVVNSIEGFRNENKRLFGSD